MKLFSLQIRNIVILALCILVSSTSLAATQRPTIRLSDQQRFLSLDSFVQGWHALEAAVSNGFHQVIDFFQDIFHAAPQNAPKFNYDVTLVGFVNFADGIGRHPILFKECLGSNIKINFVSTRNIPPAIEDAQLGLPRLDPANTQDIGAVSILTDILADKAITPYMQVPSSLIKIAYTMFESTEIPKAWVSILNSKFDMAVVPDPFLIEVYKNSGVQIPVFVLPLPLMLYDFFQIQKSATPQTPFVFGLSGGFWERKNHMRVLEAFAAEFGNRSDVKLRLHGRFGEENIINALAAKIKEYNLTNVELIVKPYDWNEYLEFFKSLDCYVFLSKGEGFSISPREALACNLPCILTKNTAQITICNSGAVRIVPSNIPVPAFYDCHYDSNYTNYWLDCCNKSILKDQADLLVWKSPHLGYQFDCTVHDARHAMRDVYENYALYYSMAQQGKEWVTQYLREYLSQKYITLVKPETIILGNENIIGDKFLMTNSKNLYEKYQYLLGNT